MGKSPKIPPIGAGQREKSIVLDNDPPGLGRGGDGGGGGGGRRVPQMPGNNSGGHQRLPVVNTQGLSGRLKLNERSTKTLLAAALAAQQDIENQYKMNQEQWDGEKKNKKILQDHIVSIGNVVRQLGLELNAVEQRAQMTV